MGAQLKTHSSYWGSLVIGRSHKSIEAKCVCDTKLKGSQAICGLLLCLAACSCPAPDRRETQELMRTDSSGAGDLMPSTEKTPLIGLAFPRGNVRAADSATVAEKLRELAQRSFVGSSDTVDAQVFALQNDPAASMMRTRYYLLALPFGDREVSRWNDSASFYLLGTVGTHTSLSPKLVLAHDPGGGIGVRDLVDVNGDRELEAVLCQFWFEGDSVVLLSRVGAALRTRPRPSSMTKRCPRSE